MSTAEPTAPPSAAAPAASRATPRAGALGWRGPVLLAIAACAAFAYRGVFAIGEPTPNMPDAEAFFFEPTASSPTLVFAAFAWMLFRRAHRIRASLGAPPRRVLGALALAAGLALAAWACWVATPSFLLPSLSATLIGAALWLGGTTALRAVWLPALFVLFAFPLPTVLVNQIVYPLQLGVAEAAAWLMNAVGMTAHVAGDRVAFRGAIFQVIESCSGLRGTATIVMSAVLYVELFHRSRLRSALIVAASPVIALLSNQVRVLTIMLNPYSSIAAVHTAQGLAMIVIAVFSLSLVDALLGRLLPDPGPRPRVRLPRREPLRPAALVPLAAVALALLAATVLVRPWTPPPRTGRPLSTLPVAIDGIQATSLKLDRDFMGSTQFTEWVHRRYGEGERALELFAGADDRNTGAVRLLSPKTGVLESGWTVVEQGRVQLASGREADWFELRVGPRRKLAWRWHLGVGSRAEELARGVFATERSPLRRPGRAVVVRVATPLGDGQTARAAAEQRLADLAAQVEAELAAILAAQSTSANPLLAFMNAR